MIGMDWNLSPANQMLIILTDSLTSYVLGANYKLHDYYIKKKSQNVNKL